MIGKKQSRREFLALVAAANGAMLLGGEPLSWAAESDSRVEAILAKTITVDMHNHANLSPRSNQPRQNADSALSPQEDPSIAVAMRRAGDNAICLAPALDGVLMRGPDSPKTRSNLARDPKPGELYKVHLESMDQMDAALGRNNLKKALKLSDLQSANKERLPAVIYDSEGADFIEGHLDRLGEAYRRGMRKLQLVHYAINDIADFQSGPVEHHGLSPFGAQVVKESNRLGMVVDVAHATFDAVKGVVKASSKPIVLSHTALAGSKAQGTFWGERFRGGLPTMLARQVTPDHARAVAETGGVVGIWHLFSSARAFVEGVREMVDVVGVDHVGIGMDWNVQAINHIWPDQKEGMMYTVIGEMLKQAFTPDECSRIAGGNFCRVFGACV
jgi:membrane dipeptidase